MQRRYNERKLRNINRGTYFKIDATYDKSFSWNRAYDLKWDLTKQLKMSFNASNNARIDEPEGIVNKKLNEDRYEHWRDSVMANIMRFGRNTHYGHTFNVNYTVPINKIPLFSWISSNAQYRATYDWNAGPLLKKNPATNEPNHILGNPY